MIRYLTYKEIDKTKWDECIDRSVNARIYAYSWYLDIVSPKWEALVKNDYEAVMPLMANKKYGIHYLYPPYFAQQLGVFSNEKISKKNVEEFLKAIPEYFKFIETNLNSQNTFELQGFHAKKNINIELSLDATYQNLYGDFSDDIKRNIKKAVRSGIHLKKNIPPADIISIFRKNTGKKISNLTDKNYKTLLHLINTCIKKGYGETFGALTSENKLCAGVVWLVKGDRAVFLFSATDEIAKRTGAMHFLINEFIHSNAGKNSILDFEGSNIPGLARFYKGFGSKEYVYLQIRKNNLPRLFRWIKG